MNFLKKNHNHQTVEDGCHPKNTKYLKILAFPEILTLHILKKIHKKKKIANSYFCGTLIKLWKQNLGCAYRFFPKTVSSFFKEVWQQFTENFQSCCKKKLFLKTIFAFELYFIDCYATENLLNLISLSFDNVKGLKIGHNLRYGSYR